ncbi:MAG: spore germination protein [Oscillospiraceae bacterium]|nr:spore germination protein [Oscillospiraceae bacterium]
MGLFGEQPPEIPFHAEKKPEFTGTLNRDNLKAVFSGCVDYMERQVCSAVTGERFDLCWVDGMVRGERLNDYVIHPLCTVALPRTTQAKAAVLASGTWNLSVQERTTLDEVVQDLVIGFAALFCEDGVLTCGVATEEKRGISPPENEVADKGSKDSFVESLRTNTSLTRRHLRTPHLRVEEFTVGRESRTPVDLIYLDGLTNQDLVKAIREKIVDIDIDGLLSTGDFESYVAQRKGASFPQMVFTERPDRFCRGLLNGRVGVLMEGIPLGGILPGNLAQFVEAPQDREYHWIIASALLLLRYLCLLATLLLPALYIAIASFHFEMIPTKLAMSIISSKQNVPFSTPMEVLMLLVAFEILQEAGLRLPKTIGQTVSIIGGLVVGQAAVEAKILSPAVVIVVAAAGIAGFTMPNQDFSNALRVWRFVLAALAGLAGLLGMVAGAALLICHLADMESFGIPYLTPFAVDAGQQVEDHAVFRQPLWKGKLRELWLRPENQRRQK